MIKEIGPSVFTISEDQIRERIEALDNDMWKVQMNMLKAKETTFWSSLHDRLHRPSVDKTNSVEDN